MPAHDLEVFPSWCEREVPEGAGDGHPEPQPARACLSDAPRQEPQDLHDKHHKISTRHQTSGAIGGWLVVVVVVVITSSQIIGIKMSAHKSGKIIFDLN